MCKFENENSPGFDLVVEGVQRYAEEAPATIKSRWDAEREERNMQKKAAAEELFPGTFQKIHRTYNDWQYTDSIKGTPQSDSTSTFGESSQGKAPFGQKALPSNEAQASFDDQYILEEVSNQREFAWKWRNKSLV